VTDCRRQCVIPKFFVPLKSNWEIFPVLQKRLLPREDKDFHEENSRLSIFLKVMKQIEKVDDVIVFIQIETVSESQHKLIPETKIIPKWIR
jgi:hypothetical protein